MFWIQKATAFSATVFAVFAMGVGVGLSGRQVEGVAEGQEKGAVRGLAPAPLQADLDKEIASVEARLAPAEERLELLKKLAALSMNNIETARKSGIPADQLQTATESAERARKDADQAAAEVKTLRTTLDKLKAAKAGMSVDQMNRMRRRAQLEADRTGNQAELAQLREGLKVLPRQIEQSEKALRQIEKELEELGSPKAREKPEPKKVDPDQLRRDNLQKAADEQNAHRQELEQMAKRFREEKAALEAKHRALLSSRGHLELLVRGAVPNCVFGLREFDAQGNELL